MKSSICTTPLFKNRVFLRQKYEVERLSARQIAFLIGCSHSVINRALIKYGITKTKQRAGWVEYGWKMKFGKRVKHVRRQKIIQQMVRKRTKGWSYRKIADSLNTRCIPSPAGKTWGSGTVRRLLTQ